MRYPGNANISRDIQQRILSTFQQTLEAVGEGNRREALLGCDFILRLDSLFEPARELHKRLESGEGPVETTDLAATLSEVQGSDAAATDVVEPEADGSEATAQPAAAEPEPPVTGEGSAPSLEEGPVLDQLDDLTFDLAERGKAAAVASDEIDSLDDLDLGIPDVETPVAAPEPAADGAESAHTAARAEAPEPAAPEPAAPEPAAAEPTEAPEVSDGLADLDVTLEPAAAEPAVAEQAEAAEPAVAERAEAPEPAAAEPTEAAEPAEGPDPAVAEQAEPEPAAAEQAASEVSDDLADLDVTLEPASGDEPDDGSIALHTEPAARLDNESEQRVSDLLAEGQAAFDKGEYQGSIDAWSRIFLIDIDHPEANRRIEQARKLKAEADRQIEERFHEGLAQLEAGDTGAATETFRDVLAAQPAHLAARDYLEKLEAGEVPVVKESKAAADEEGDEIELPELPIEAEESDGEDKPKPDRGSKPVGTRMVTVKRSPWRSPTFLVIAALGLALVVAGGWYLSTNWSRLFPNSADESEAETASRPDPLARAQALHEEGRTPMAIAQLRRLPPAHPQYAEAQALIAQWEALQAPEASPTEGVAPEQLAFREELIASAQQARARGENLLTSELLSEAAAITPLKGAEVQLLAQADEQLRELQNLITLFRQGDWDFVLRDLWLLRESDPGNADVTRLLIDSYYNLGVRDLQRNDAAAASEKLREAIDLDGGDAELRRLVRFAEAYQNRPPDLMYRIFVKYLPFR